MCLAEGMAGKLMSQICLQVHLTIIGKGVHLVEGMVGRHQFQSLLTGSSQYNEQRGVLGGGDGW